MPTLRHRSARNETSQRLVFEYLLQLRLRYQIMTRQVNYLSASSLSEELKSVIFPGISVDHHDLSGQRLSPSGIPAVKLRSSTA